MKEPLPLTVPRASINRHQGLDCHQREGWSLSRDSDSAAGGSSDY